MAMEEDKAAVDRIIRNHAFYGDEATEILNLCTAKDATIAGLKAEVERLKSKVNPCPFCSSFYELDASHQLLKDEVASLKSRAESAEARLALRGKVTSGVFCDGCASWEQMAWEAEAKVEKAIKELDKWNSAVPTLIMKRILVKP